MILFSETDGPIRGSTDSIIPEEAAFHEENFSELLSFCTEHFISLFILGGVLLFDIYFNFQRSTRSISLPVAVPVDF